MGGLQVSAMMKKHLVEGVVPVLIELKRSLEGLRHRLLGDLLTCIRALLKDHKNEVLPCKSDLVFPVHDPPSHSRAITPGLEDGTG